MIVLDASAALELLLGTPTGALIAERLSSPEETMHAPHLLDLEVLQVLRRYERAGWLTDSRALEAIQDLVDLDINRYPHDAFARRIWELRANFTAYDAAYIAVAEALSAVMLTCDGKLASAPGHSAQIEAVTKPH